MVSEQFDSTTRDSRWSSYCVYEAMAGDLIPQKVEPTKKKVIPIQSIVSDFKQELQNQRAIWKQFLNELAVEMRGNAGTQSISEEEVSNTVSQKVTQQPKPGDSQHMEIESGVFTLDGEDVVHSTGLSHVNLSVTTVNVNEKESVHEEVFDFTGKMKPVPDSKIVTMLIGEEREKTLLMDEKRGARVIGESPHYLFNYGGNTSTNCSSINSPELKAPASSPNPDPEPPDVYHPTAKVSFPMESSTTLRSTMRVVGIQTVSSFLAPSHTRKEAMDDDQAWPNPGMGLETAQVSPDPFASKHQRLLSPTSLQTPSVSRGQPFDRQENQSSRSYKAKYGDTKREKAEVAGSRTGKIQGILEGMNQLGHPVEIVGSTTKEQFSATNDREITNLVSLKTSSFPPFIKLHKTINQSLNQSEFRFKPNPYPKLSPNSTTTDFIVRPNLDPKLASNSNSKPNLNLPNQLHQSFNTASLLLPCPILILTDVDQLISTDFSLLRLSSYKLTPNCKNTLKSSGVCLVDEAVWQKDRYEGVRVWALDLFSFPSNKFGYGPSTKPKNKLHVWSFAEAVTRLFVRKHNSVLCGESYVAMCFLLSIIISVSLFRAVIHIPKGEATVISTELLKGAQPIVRGNSFEKRAIFYQHFKYSLEGYKDWGEFITLVSVSNNDSPTLATTDRGMNMAIGTKVYIGIDPISSPFREKFRSLVGELNPLSREIDIQPKGSILSVGTVVLKDNGIGWVTDKKRNTETKSRQVHILTRESTQVEEDKKFNKVSKVVTRLTGLIFVRCCHKIMKYLVWKCINGWPGLMELIRMVVKVKLAAELFGVKTAQDKEVILLWSSIDYSIHETKLLEWFPVAELCLKVENTHIQWYVAENMSGRLAEILVTLTVSLKRKCDIMVRHSRIGNGIMWSFYEGEMEHEWKVWISVAAGLGEVAIGQQQFLYFFYPP